MRKIITVLVAAFLLAGDVSATRIKISIKHPGRIDGEGNQNCGSGCSCPLGLCTGAGIVMQNGDLSQAEIAADMGTGTISMYGNITTVYLDPPANTVARRVGYISIVFDQQTALEDGTIPLEADFSIDPAVARSLGYAGIKIRAGTYNVQSTNQSQYGQVILQCEVY